MRLFVPVLCQGWSSWNAFGDLSTHRPPIGEDALLEIADKIVSSGLRDAGYVNFNVDAGWAHDGEFFGRGRWVGRCAARRAVGGGAAHSEHLTLPSAHPTNVAGMERWSQTKSSSRTA